MLIVFDTGNTHTVVGCFDFKGNLINTFRLATKDNLTEDEVFSYIKNITEFNNIELKDIEGIIISSVVPNMIYVLSNLSKKYFNINPLVVGQSLKLPFTFAENLNSTGFGADRIIGITQALKEYTNKNIVVFDFGTATTYEVLKDKVYIGGGILPGINMSINALFSNTAKLPKVNFTKPDSILGKNTVKQIQAGIFYGYVGQVKEIINLIKKELDDPFIIATGGLGKVISDEVEEIDIYDDDLSIKGLYSLYKLNI